jgi:hypothetical protein
MDDLGKPDEYLAAQQNVMAQLREMSVSVPALVAVQAHIDQCVAHWRSSAVSDLEIGAMVAFSAVDTADDVDIMLKVAVLNHLSTFGPRQ